MNRKWNLTAGSSMESVVMGWLQSVRVVAAAEQVAIGHRSHRAVATTTTLKITRPVDLESN